MDSIHPHLRVSPFEDVREPHGRIADLRSEASRSKREEIGRERRRDASKSPGTPLARFGGSIKNSAYEKFDGGERGDRNDSETLKEAGESKNAEKNGWDGYLTQLDRGSRLAYSAPSDLILFSV